MACNAEASEHERLTLLCLLPGTVSWGILGGEGVLEHSGSAHMPFAGVFPQGPARHLLIYVLIHIVAYRRR